MQRPPWLVVVLLVVALVSTVGWVVSARRPSQAAQATAAAVQGATQGRPQPGHPLHGGTAQSTPAGSRPATASSP